MTLLERNRLLITAALCFVAYVATKALTRSPLTEEDRLPSDVVGETAQSVRHYDFILKKQDIFLPQIVWLMSFPNSGTSFTMTATKKYANLSFATNYADEVTPKGNASIPIYPFHDEGPFWPGMANPKLKVNRDLPDKFVLTKTHCGSRCSDCGPDDYLESLDHFVTKCASGHARIASGEKSKRMVRTEVTYPVDHVKKAVHIVRNPFNNVVARFHLLFRAKDRKENKNFVEKYPNTMEGFQAYCKYMNDKYRDQDKEKFDAETLELLDKIPCHGEFYVYLQWHNLAFQTQQKLELDVLVVHYEDYETNLKGIMNEIVGFLEQPGEVELEEFSPGHTYPFFTDENREALRKLYKKIAIPETWSELERYFDSGLYTEASNGDK